MAQIQMKVTNHFMYQLRKKLVDMTTDSFIVMLMRSGFVFDPKIHQKLINIKTDTGSIALTWAATDKSVARGSGSFITDGFVVGNQCTSDDTSNPGPLTIASVSALKIIFNEAVVNSSATKTLTSDDELETNYGYTQSTMVLTTPVLTEDNMNNRVDTTFDDVVWSASGGSIGPSAAIVVYDDDVSDKVIAIGGQFTGEQTATTGNPFTVADIIERGINY